MGHLTGEQRYVISVLQKRSVHQKEIAKELEVNPSTICRELKRKGGKRGGYNAQTARLLAQERKKRYTWNRRFTPSVEKRVRNYLENEQWSPEQIAGYCKANNIEMVSPERIYQFIRKDKLNYSWKKGQVENMNKLIRQYIPKKEHITTYNMKNIKDIQHKINSIPGIAEQS